MIEKVNSIDGFFKEKINIIELKYKKQQFDKINTIVGEGNSISQLPFLKNTKHYAFNSFSSVTFILASRENLISYTRTKSAEDSTQTQNISNSSQSSVLYVCMK